MNYLKRKILFIKSFFQNRHNMSKGQYIIDENLTLIYLKNSNSERIMSIKNSLYSNKEYEVKLIKKNINKILKIFFNSILFFNVLCNNRRKFKGDGDVFFIDERCSKIKIFSFQKQKVVTIFKNELEYYENLELLDLNTFLPSPKIYEFDSKKLCYTEELIDFIPECLWDHKTYDQIFHDYLYWIERALVETENRTIKRSLLDYIESKPRQDISEIFECITVFDKDLLIPFFWQHGDFWSSNILISKDKVTYIDFDRYRKTIFYYDFFYFIWKDYLIHNRLSLIKLYFSGFFDSFLKSYFLLFGENYMPEYRKTYFDSYLTYSYYTEWFDEHDKIKSNLRSKYKQLIFYLEGETNVKHT